MALSAVVESQIPIDIHTNKLLDWLISRRHVPREWQTKMLEIRQKINEAIKDMPVHDGIAKLLSGSYINYYHCQKIVKILQETEADSKNFFGQYGSQRMKDWKEVTRLYEKDNVYLGEVASLLLRNVNYEIPALKRQVQKIIQQRVDYDKKITEYEKQSNNVRNEINVSFKELGIAGKNIRLELLEKARELPKMNQKVAKDAKELEQAVIFYKNAVKALTETDKDVLKTLQFVIEKGDVTVYEWRTGEVPKSVEEAVLNLKAIEDETQDETIDFDLDLDVDTGADIDWGISTDDAVEETKDMTGVAKGTDARSLLGHPETRTMFANDVLELEAFVKLRLFEMKTESNINVGLLPEALLAADEKQLAAMLENIQRVSQGLNNPTAVNYFIINTNPSYVDQLAKKLHNKQQTLDKLHVARGFLQEQKLETVKEQETVESKTSLLIEKTRELQDQIEADISKRYNGRPVNLMGGINTI